MTSKKYFSYAFYSIMLVLSNNFVNGMKANNELTKLLDNPIETLRKGRILNNYFESKIPAILNSNNSTDNKPAKFREKWYTAIDACAKKHPLFLLDECPYKNSEDHCTLSRKNNPAFRTFFEQTVSTAMSQKIEANPGRTMSYVGFGSGECFSDFRVLAKTLKEHPQAMLHIHLIDTLYSSYTGPKLVRNTCETKKDDFSDSHEFNQFTKECILQLLLRQPDNIKNNRSIANLFCSQALQDFLKSFLWQEALFKQFLQGLQNNFPNAQLRLFIHSSWDRYLNNIATHNLPHADVIAASDILDGETEIENCYRDLCVETFKHNKLLYNSLLTADNNKNLWLHFITSSSNLLALQANSFSSEELCSDLTAIKAYQKICEGISNSEDIIDELTQTQTS